MCAPLFHVVLHEPEIPANTGNIARLCGAARLRLHLIHPLGFKVDDKHLKRAGLDYWDLVDIRHHPTWEAFLQSREQDRGAGIIGFSARAAQDYTKAAVSRGDYLLFGKESVGLPKDLSNTYPCYRIPMWGEVRSLNLSTAVGIVVYHYLHQMGSFQEGE
ncbi:MAG: tRNA (cytidine(34)-2'-O)-methyltransferase [Desulfatiglandales bacterium]